MGAVNCVVIAWGQDSAQIIPGMKSIPPPPHFGQKGLSRGGWGGELYFEAPCRRIFVRPLRKESGKSTTGQGPKSAERVRPGVSKESKKSLKPDFRTLLRLRGTLFRHFGALPRGTLSGLFLDSSGSGPEGVEETLCGAGPIATLEGEIWPSIIRTDKAGLAHAVVVCAYSQLLACAGPVASEATRTVGRAIALARAPKRLPVQYSRQILL